MCRTVSAVTEGELERALKEVNDAPEVPWIVQVVVPRLDVPPLLADLARPPPEPTAIRRRSTFDLHDQGPAVDEPYHFCASRAATPGATPWVGQAKERSAQAAPGALGTAGRQAMRTIARGTESWLPLRNGRRRLPPR